MDFAEVGIRFEDDLAPALPVLEPVRVGADRVVHDAARRVGVLLDHLARDDAKRRLVEVREQRVVGRGQLEAQRVLVDRAEPRDLGVVIEAAGRSRFLLERVEADQLAAYDVGVRRAHARVDQPLPRIDDVGGGQLALLPVDNAGSSLKWMPGLIRIVHVLPSAEYSGIAAATLGT